MMAARKWDRIETMSEDRRYDIFANPGDGGDGTLIAEIRDLRCYLLLIEAELVARGVVGPYTRGNHVTLQYEEQTRPGTPEDGGHHESAMTQAARAITQRLDDGLKLSDVPNHQLGLYREMGTIDGPVMIVNRFTVDKDLWEHLPRLRMELNNKEYEDLPAWYQPLYDWHNAQSKWSMRPEARKYWGQEI